MAQKAIQQDKILILDFGSATGQQIARAVRAAGVYCELMPWSISLEKIKEFNPKGIILGGRGGFVSSAKLSAELFELNIPVLALDDSAALVAEFFGGQLGGVSKLFGQQEIRARGHSVLLKDIQDRANEAGHGLMDIWFPEIAPITQLPEGFKAIATNPTEEVMGIANEDKNIFALQGKLEVEQTPQGDAIIARFAVEICQTQASWTVPNIVEATVKSIRAQVGGMKFY